MGACQLENVAILLTVLFVVKKLSFSLSLCSFVSLLLHFSIFSFPFFHPCHLGTDTVYVGP